MVDVRLLLNNQLEDCLKELKISRDQLGEYLNQIGRCLDQSSGWHAMDLGDGRICVGMQRSNFLYIIDPQREQSEQITQIDITPDYIPIQPKKIIETDEDGFKEFVEKHRHLFNKR